MLSWAPSLENSQCPRRPQERPQAQLPSGHLTGQVFPHPDPGLLSSSLVGTVFCHHKNLSRTKAGLDGAAGCLSREAGLMAQGCA